MFFVSDPVNSIDGLTNRPKVRHWERLLSTQHALGLFLGFFFGAAAALLISGEPLPQLAVLLFFSGVGFLSRNMAHLVLSVLSGVAMTGIVVFLYDLWPGTPSLSLSVLATVSGLSILATSTSTRDLFQATSPQIRMVELFILGTAFALIQRWPLHAPVDYLSFLSYEDNAAWVQTAAGFRENQYVAGLGGFVLDPFMGALQGIISIGSDHLGNQASYAYVVTGITYKMIEFLAIITAGLLVTCLTPVRERHSTISLILAPASSALTYAALQLPQSTGHLTFIGALLFLWSLGLMGTASFEPLTRNSRIVALVCSLLLVGMIGMWWPLLLILPFALAISVSLHLPWTEIRSRISSRRISLLTQTAFGLGTIICGAVLAAPIVTNFKSLPFRQFFFVKGGLQIATSMMLVTSALAVFLLALLLNVEKIDSENQSASKVFLAAVLLIASLAIVMYFVSLFVGPEYTQNYSVQKITLLFALSGIPLLAVVLAICAQHPALIAVSFSALPLFFFIGSLTIGWNINTPREPIQPSWAASLLRSADAHPNAIILCSTSDQSRNLDSYLCSRHATALQPGIGLLAAEWRHVQLFPARTTSEDDERITRISEAISSLIGMKKEIILLSLEEKSEIAVEDQWWMSRIPLSQMTLVGTNS